MTTTVSFCLGCRNHVHGNGGRNLEFRLAAFNTEHLDQFSQPTPGADVFSGSDAQKIAESGQAPEGFKWLPISDFLVGQTGGLQPMGIMRVVNGQEFLLVADQPGMILTHAANTPAWGVKSVRITTSYQFGPVVEAVEIKLDDTAGGMLRQFTQKYIRHSLAVVVDGQVIMNAQLLSPVRRNVLQLRFPEGERSEAERLRDSLMK
ncbi:MAG: hypothetical protein ABSC77_06380 [Terracidiphilus sp.]